MEEFVEEHRDIIFIVLMASCLICMVYGFIQTVITTNRIQRDEDDRTVDYWEPKQIQVLLHKEAEGRGVDMSDKEVVFFHSRSEGFLGARIMRKVNDD